jgi:RNA recognition motif-containing protein
MIVALLNYASFIVIHCIMVVEKNKLFVGNLDSRVKWFHLKEFFSQYGEVSYTKVVFDRDTKRSRGFGFIVFANEEDAANALEKGNNVAIELPEASFPEKPVRLMYAEANENAPVRHDERPAAEETTEE